MPVVVPQQLFGCQSYGTMTDLARMPAAAISRAAEERAVGRTEPAGDHWRRPEADSHASRSTSATFRSQSAVSWAVIACSAVPALLSARAGLKPASGRE